MSSTSCRRDDGEILVRELGLIEYREAWQLQRGIAEARAERDGQDTLLLLEHQPVYTAGRRTAPEGGKITWHGPGQLVGYPVIALADPIDVVDFVRRLEQALIQVCDQFGLVTGRIEGRSGVWLAASGTRPERKIAAFGVRVQRGVTLHGFAINCAADLSAFDSIVPCGIRDAGVTSLSVELGRPVTVAEVLPLAREATLAALNGDLPVTTRDVRPAAPAAPGIRFELAGR
jgi:lipoyl(octanoyl) transferase